MCETLVRISVSKFTWSKLSIQQHWGKNLLFFYTSTHHRIQCCLLGFVFLYLDRSLNSFLVIKSILLQLLVQEKWKVTIQRKNEKESFERKLRDNNFPQSDGFEAFSLALTLPDTHTLSLSQSHATTHSLSLSLSLSLSADVGIHGNNNQTRALRLIRPLTNCAKSLQRQAPAIATTQASGQSDTSSSALRQGEHFNCHGQDLWITAQRIAVDCQWPFQGLQFNWISQTL